MWEHPATQANAQALRAFGHTLLGPAAGRLACGDEGAGRLVEPAEIVEAACKLLKA
jgi:phosphopantothenoylcysteine decarboxylase/phosphopantothenate--cysteine ligase